KLILLIKNNALIDLFSNAGLPVLLQLISSKTVLKVSELTGYDIQTIYKILQKAKEIGLIKVIDNKYVLNELNWFNAKDFFNSLFEQEMSFDSRIPKNSVIFFKSEKEIVFSNDELIDASFTAFSAFDKSKIKFFPLTNYFVLPKQTLSIQKIYEHAVKVIEKNRDYRLLLVLGVFVLKNNIKSDEVSKNLFKVFAGEKIKDFPSAEDLREKAKEYGVIK
ncbi:MAG: hypothetical protein JW703_02865, partial [Candidatus Diapherotrites archaeon]|nr:hypothetical protein [Candidatus Diapherotrites archaeon]